MNSSEVPISKRLNLLERGVNVQDKRKIFEHEIIRGNKNMKYYEKMARNYTYRELKDFSVLALKNKNVTALRALAKTNVFATADAMNEDLLYSFFRTKSDALDIGIIELFFLLRSRLNPKLKNIFKAQAKKIALKVYTRVAARGLKKELAIKIPYEEGFDEFDMDELMEIYLEKGYLTREDIHVIDRTSKRKSIVVMFDTSGSIYGEKLTHVTMSAAVLAYNLKSDNHSQILFNTKAKVIKKMNEKISIDKLVDQILETEPAGKTNISDALQKGLAELNKTKDYYKRGILITDGIHNIGPDPLPFAARFKRLDVVAIPSQHPSSFKNCKEIAKKGKGQVYKMKSLRELPSVLTRMLTRPTR